MRPVAAAITAAVTVAVFAPLALAGGLDPVGHVVNHYTVKIGDWWIWSSNQTMLVISGLIMCLLGPWLAKEIGTGPEEEGHARYTSKHPFAQFVEVVALFLRDEIARPLLHERTDKFMPFLWTLFFFLLINNLLGLVPLLDLNTFLMPGPVYQDKWAFMGTTATQNAYVTGSLAIVAFLVINIAGIRELGFVEYCKHFTGGAPFPVSILMVPIEIVGALVKPFALALRLFANMTAGHTLMATMYGFVGFAIYAGLSPLLIGGITVASALGAFAIYFLEIFVAFLQAFIFTFLTIVFIGQLAHHGDHDHDHAHADERDAHAPEATPALATAG